MHRCCLLHAASSSPRPSPSILLGRCSGRAGGRPSNPITDEKVYNMTMTSKIADGFHGNEGRKLINAYCELQDVPAGGSFNVDHVPY